MPVKATRPTSHQWWGLMPSNVPVAAPVPDTLLRGWRQIVTSVSTYGERTQDGVGLEPVGLPREAGDGAVL